MNRLRPKEWIEENKEFLTGAAALTGIIEFLGIRDLAGRELIEFYSKLNELFGMTFSLLVFFAIIGFYLLIILLIYQKFKGGEDEE